MRLLGGHGKRGDAELVYVPHRGLIRQKNSVRSLRLLGGHGKRGDAELVYVPHRGLIRQKNSVRSLVGFAGGLVIAGEPLKATR